MSDKLILGPDRVTDQNNIPVSGAQAFFYLSGTTTPAVVYADQGLTTPHPTPVVADATGILPPMFSGVLLRCIVTDANDNVLPGYPVDPVSKSFTVSGAAQISFAPSESLPATTVQQAIEMLDARFGSAGQLDYFARRTPPVGWLVVDGSAVSNSTYSALDSAIYWGDSENDTAPWGYRCTDPNDPTNTRSTSGGYIVLPDPRGLFLRAWNSGDGIDSGRGFGTTQNHAMLNHTHSGTTSGSGAHTHDTGIGGGFLVGGAGGGPGMGIGGGYVQTGQVLNTGISGFHDHTFATGNPSAGGGNETRPANFAALLCIKY